MRVLVAYASSNGSTEEIAEAIADELTVHGLEVECRAVQEADADGFDAVVLGSAVYMGRWLRPARRFLKAQADRLARVPFWIFSSGPFGEQAAHPSPDDARWTEPPKILARAEALGARGHIVFGGRLPADPHGFVESAMVRNTPADQRDARDWAGIRAWAASIAASLGAEAVQDSPVISTR